MPQSLERTFLAALFAASLVLPGSLRAEGYLELRFGPGFWSSTVTTTSNTSDNYLFLGGTPALSVGWITEDGLESVLSLEGQFFTTNNGFRKNGRFITSAPYSNERFIVKNFGISLCEYWNIDLFKGFLTLSPCLDAKFAWYSDISGGSEFTNATTDYWVSAFRLGLRAQVHLNKVTLSLSYKYPLFGLLTDRIWNENRQEDDLLFTVSYALDRWYVKAGFNRYQLTYANPVLTGNRETYANRVMVNIFAGIGFTF